MNMPLEILSGLIAILSLGYVAYLHSWVKKQDVGTPEMQEISNAIRDGANAFVKRQYTTIAMLAVVFGAVLLLAYGIFQQNWPTGINTAVSFWFGALCSGIAGVIGMKVAVQANIRTASAARKSMGDALLVAFRGGAVSGITVVAMSLIGISAMFFIFDRVVGTEVSRIPSTIIAYGFGASFVALFAQLGGGIYTKAADVGADLVGKVEAGIPEDDPRNPAVIADLVGDNVGDCAGRGADLFESTAAENIGAMILGAGLYAVLQKVNPNPANISWVLFPLVARAFGLLASMLGIATISNKDTKDPMATLNMGYYVTAFLGAIGFGVATWWLLSPTCANWMYLFLSGVVGIVLSIVFLFITQYYTEYKYRPVQSIAEASETGHGTNIITGLAVAYECTALPIIAIAVALALSFWCGVKASVLNETMLDSVISIFNMTPEQASTYIHYTNGIFGTAIATMGMLATCAYILAMDTFGPITDNAGGIVEMSGAPENIRMNTDRLDAVGNTTKALTKGYAVGSAALAAFLLFSAYIEDTNKLLVAAGRKTIESVNLINLPTFIGAMLGAMLVFLFSAFAIRAVSKAAQYIIQNVRDQFKANPGIMKGTSKPDYGQCVDIATKGALKEMILPGVIVIVVPILIGVILKAEAVAAMLMVGTITGILMGLVMNNGGGAWDNAKKYIELGHHGGKGSFAHKAAVTGDTVGDPFKDTAGPSLHVFIKLLSTLTLALAALFI